MKDHKKNNARTFRYSDEVAAILQQHNNDFDGLVLECFYELPRVKRLTAMYQKENAELIERRDKLYEEIRELKQIKSEISRIEILLSNLQSKIM